MTDIGAETRTYLQTKSAVTDLVSTRMYPDALPENVTLPAAVLNVISTSSHEDLNSGASTAASSRVQIDSYAATRSGSVALAEAIRKAAFQGVNEVSFGSTYVGAVNCLEAARYAIDNPDDGSSLDRYITSQDYMIFHAQA